MTTINQEMAKLHEAVDKFKAEMVKALLRYRFFRWFRCHVQDKHLQWPYGDNKYYWWQCKRCGKITQEKKRRLL